MRAQFAILLICLVFAYAEDFSSPKYQAQTSQQKMDQLWKAITANQTPYGWYSLISVGMIFFQSMKPTFDTYSDVIPSGRKKLIHSVGAIAQFELIAEQDTPYTGMFKGVSNALIRISTAKQASKDKEPLGNFAPGMGIKLLRDKTPSANLVAMYGVDGQDSWNMFEYDWSNHIPDPKDPFLQKLGKKFAEATPYIGRIGVKTWAKYDEKGNILEDADLKMPFKLIFRATPEVKKMFPGDRYTGELHELIKAVKIGTNVFDVLAQAEPESTPVKIATFRTKSEFVTSKFGDKDLFFQHNYLEDDLKLHPNWENLAKVTPGFFGKLREIFHK